MQRYLIRFYTRGVGFLIKKKKGDFTQQNELIKLKSVKQISSFLEEGGKHAVLQLNTMQDVPTVKALFKGFKKKCINLYK